MCFRNPDSIEYDERRSKQLRAGEREYRICLEVQEEAARGAVAAGGRVTWLSAQRRLYEGDAI